MVRCTRRNIIMPVRKTRIATMTEGQISGPGGGVPKRHHRNPLSTPAIGLSAYTSLYAGGISRAE